MEKHPLDDTFDKVTKDLRSGIDAAMLHLQQGMQEYLSDAIDLPKLLEMIKKMGLLNTPAPKMDYYKILGLEKTASNDEVKERYRIIMDKIHPDIAGEEMTMLSALVNTAYSIICKERGI